MCTPTVAAVAGLSFGELLERFQEALPVVERVARFHFRHLRCADARADTVQEAVGLAWAWAGRLARRGRDASRFPTALAAFACRAVRCGRRVAGQEKARDVLSAVAQRRHGFAVTSLPTYNALAGTAVEEALADNTVTPPPDQVQFRVDFPDWHGGYGRRDQQI